MTRPITAAARTVATLAAGAALVYGAGQVETTVDVRTDPVAGAAGQVAVTSSALFCPGAEIAGVPGVPSVATIATLIGSAAPVEALPPAVTSVGTTGDLQARTGQDGILATDTTATGGARSSDARTPVTATMAGPDPALVTATGARAPGLIAGQQNDAAGKTVAGLAALPCLTPTADAWLTGGSGEPGRQERLLLLNPGANSVTVDVDVFGKTGPIDAPGGRGIVVPPRARTSVLLDALAPDEASPAFHLVSRGGFVVAALNDYWLDGVTPRGIEDLAPLATPGTRLVVPGIPADVPATVRVVGAGEKEALVQIRALTTDGPRALPGGRGVLRVPAGSVAELSIPAPDATLALEITADQPVTAAVLSAPKSGSDFGWSVASPATAAVSAAAYPPLAADSPRHRTLALAAVDGPVTAQVTTRAADGAPRTATIAVPADASRTFDVSDSIAVWVRPTSGAGQLHAAVTTSAPAGDDFVLAGLPLQPVRLTVTPVTVQPDRG